MEPDDNSNAPSRRQVVGGLAMGIAAAFATTPAAVATDAGTATAPAQPLRNPLTLYPKPPFERQSQPWPGLAGRMNPRPD